MADPSQCPQTDLGDALSQVVIVAFDFAGTETKNLPALLSNSLQSESVQQAIREGMQTFAMKKVASGTTEVTDAETKELLGLLEKVGGKVGDQISDEIKKSSQYKRLEDKIKALEKTLSCSPMGVWVDNNKGLVLVVGIGVAFGSAAALFLTKTGGPVVDLPIGLLKEKPFQLFKVGGFTMKGQLLEFKPDKQVLGAGILATQKWEKVELSFKIGIIASGEHVKEVNGQAVVKSNDFSITVNGAAKPEEKKINLGLGLGFRSSSLPGPLNISVGAVVTDGQVTGGNLQASMKTSAGTFAVNGSTSGSETRALATFTVPW
jgi:hypothetical protein